MPVLIDDRRIELPAGARLNAIEAARLAGVEIPHYCWHPGLSIAGSCRMCLVEIGTFDPATGKTAMQPKLVPACNTIVTDNMVIVTNSPKVAAARAMVEEDLLLRHPIDCPICDKAGECLLQDYHFQYGQAERRADLRPFSSRRRDLGDVTLFVDRCVMCGRCVRFVQEISGTKELMFTGRGADQEINVFEGVPLRNNLSGNVVDLCPVGALADKDFLYRQRVWFLQSRPGVCTGCSTGCSILVESNHDRVWRIKPRENQFVNKWWICNDGRYDYPHVHDPRRITRPIGPGGLPLDWTGLPAELNLALATAGRLAAAVSPFATVEEAYLLCKLIRRHDANALLALAPVPEVGEDEVFPGGFAVRAEKCPNRRGVEAVLAHFARPMLTFDQLLEEIDAGAITGVWIAGGYKRPWIGQATAERFKQLKLLVVQDLFPSSLADRATYLLPSAAYVEYDGSLVNRADRLQSVRRAIRPPAGVRQAGSVYWEMLGRQGLYDSAAVLEEIAREIPYFSAAAGSVPEVGVSLRANLLA
jgi:NADH-quinone oxidoreductase subunit G